MPSEATVELPSIPASSQVLIDKMSPETAAVARAAMAQHYKVDHVGQVAKPAVTVTAEPVAAPTPTSERLAQWRALEAGWTGEKSVLIAQAAKSGIDLTVSPQAEAALTVASVAAREEAAVAKAIAPAESYDKLIHSNSRELSPEALGHQDTFFKHVFAKLGVPAANSQALLDSLIAAQALYPPLEEGADQDDIAKRILVERDTRLLQGSVIRGFQDKNIADDAKIAIDALKAADPKAHDVLYNSGAFMSANSFHQLALIGRVLSARKAKP